MTRLSAAAVGLLLLVAGLPSDAGDPTVVAAYVDAPSPQVVRVASTEDGAAATSRRLAAAPQVTAAQQTAATAMAGDPLPAGDPGRWGHERVGADALADAGIDGGGLTVAVLDTGVDASHPDLPSVRPGFDARAGAGNADADPNGHGTHVAGVLAADGEITGILPAVDVVPVRVLDDAGGGDTADVAAGVLWALEADVDVLVLALGTTEDDPVLAAALDEAQQRGVPAVAAAGNLRLAGDPTVYPAAWGTTVAVAATDVHDAPAAISSTGAWVDVAAPGVAVVSTVPGGAAPMTGTSMAAPFAAGAVLLDGPDPPTRTVDASATRVGAGVVDLAAAAGLAPVDPAVPERGDPDVATPPAPAMPNPDLTLPEPTTPRVGLPDAPEDRVLDEVAPPGWCEQRLRPSPRRRPSEICD